MELIQPCFPFRYEPLKVLPTAPESKACSGEPNEGELAFVDLDQAEQGRREDGLERVLQRLEEVFLACAVRAM